MQFSCQYLQDSIFWLTPGNPWLVFVLQKDDTNAQGWIRLSMWGVALFVAGGVSYWQKAHDKRYALY